jgi:transposase
MIKMTKKEEKRLRYVRLLAEKKLSLRAVSKKLNLSERQVLRLKTAFKSNGETAFISKRRGKPSNRALHHDVRNNVIETAKKQGIKSPSALHAYLTEHGVKISKETVRRILIQESIWRQRSKRRYRTKALT